MNQILIISAKIATYITTNHKTSRMHLESTGALVYPNTSVPHKMCHADRPSVV